MKSYDMQKSAHLQYTFMGVTITMYRHSNHSVKRTAHLHLRGFTDRDVNESKVLSPKVCERWLALK